MMKVNMNNKNKIWTLRIAAIFFIMIAIIFFILFILYRIKLSDVSIYDETYMDDFSKYSIRSFAFFAFAAFFVFFAAVTFFVSSSVSKRGNINYDNNKNNTFKNIQTDGNNHFSSEDGICPYCGKEIDYGSFCPYCGSRLR